MEIIRKGVRGGDRKLKCVNISAELFERMKKFPDVNWSASGAAFFEKVVSDLETEQKRGKRS